MRSVTSSADAERLARPVEDYSPDNLLDRHTDRSTLEFYYRHITVREQEIVARRLPLAGGDVLSVGCGWLPGRHLFPAPAFRLSAVDADPNKVIGVTESGRADEAFVGHAGRLDLPGESFDVVLYRLVMHHIVFREPLGPSFVEARRLLRPGGALVAIEPGLWHPVGIALTVSNAAGLSTAVHGTPDDIPLSPRTLIAESEAAGLTPELHAVTYLWRRMPKAVQLRLRRLDELGSRPRAAQFGHTLMLIARKPAM